MYQLTPQGGLVWKGQLQPTPLSERYHIRIRYKLGSSPIIEVLSPALRNRGTEHIPHMYQQKTLCLYNPMKGDWNPRMRIDSTILPWAAVWLYFYEIWHATGEWLGGGDHPSAEQPNVPKAA